MIRGLCTHDVVVVVGSELLLERLHLQQTADDTRVVAGQWVNEEEIGRVVSGQYTALTQQKSCVLTQRGIHRHQRRCRPGWQAEPGAGQMALLPLSQQESWWCVA